MQIQISSIVNGFLVAAPKQLDEKLLQQMSPEQRQQYMSQPDCTFCADYEETCRFIKRFFFNGKKN